MRREDHCPSTELMLTVPSPTAEPPGRDFGDERVAAAIDPTSLPPIAREVLASLGLQVVVVHSAPPAAPRLVEADELAAVLGVTRWSVYRWAAQGRIPCVRAGRKVRFEIERVIAALRSEGPRAEAPQAAASAKLTAPPRATRTARSREAPKRHPVTGGLPRASLPRRAQAAASAQQERASARQEPVDEIARRRAVVEATRALKE